MEAPPSDEAEAIPAIRPEDMAPTQTISNDMKDRLKRELQAQGADPNKSAGNPILIVAVVIGLLVIVGGQGETAACDICDELCIAWYYSTWHKQLFIL